MSIERTFDFGIKDPNNAANDPALYNLTQLNNGGWEHKEDAYGASKHQSQRRSTQRKTTKPENSATNDSHQKLSFDLIPIDTGKFRNLLDLDKEDSNQTNGYN